MMVTYFSYMHFHFLFFCCQSLRFCGYELQAFEDAFEKNRQDREWWMKHNILWFSSLQRHQPFLTCSQIWLLPGAARKARRNEGCARAALSKKKPVQCVACNVAQPEATWVNTFLRQPGAIPSTTEVSDTLVCLSDSSKCKKERDWWSQGDGQWASECFNGV